MARTCVWLLLAAVLACVSLSARARGVHTARPSDTTVPDSSRNIPTLDASENLCVAFGWQGYVDTDLSFKDFFEANHTVAARFMLQYTRSYQAPILSAKGAGDYTVAVAGYGEGRVKAERLVLSINGAVRYYTAGSKLSTERWHWLALVREGSRLRLYLNGKELKPDNSNDTIGAGVPVGTLRLGRKATGDAQFYGLIDDVAIFDSALSPKTLKSYYDENPRLRGTEPGLVAAYLFDSQPEASRSAPYSRPVTFTTTATKISVSATRASDVDAQRLPLPQQSTKVLLPFAPGTAWKVIQGYGQPLSHHGGGCFAWDFARVDGSSIEQPVYTTAAGRVVAVSDYNDPEPSDNISKDNFNYLQMETAPGEILTYLHMKNGSITEALRSVAPPSFPKILVPFFVQPGMQVGRVGNTWLKEQPENWHLHFACAPFVNSPVSIPMAISDYEVYEPGSKTWRRVERGVPQQNEIVRRAN